MFRLPYQPTLVYRSLFIGWPQVINGDKHEPATKYHETQSVGRQCQLSLLDMVMARLCSRRRAVHRRNSELS